MTPERKEEVNRLLAKFDFGPDLELLIFNYTMDLNALVRLEAKLPRHHWCIFVGGDKAVSAELDCYDWMMDYQEPTEAEARAEAIARYLASRRVD